ncbi:MAG: glucosamine-6-phosphate deaminase [Acidobacteria bacterium]|nr:MAG: glucosamine-6-phosphate deaminase [Acidobacteriota bacterium]
MRIEVHKTSEELAKAAARQAVALVKAALAQKPEVALIVATGMSQAAFLEQLAQIPGVDWGRSVFFHLDEYVGLPMSHPASFRKYLRERVEQRLHPKKFRYINGENPNPLEECRQAGQDISQREIDVAFVGIGENGHLAFNDPPADFDTTEPYLVVSLDEACRRQQVGEGWFKSVEEVPKQAISMSVQQILKARHILCVIPDERKAKAVRDCFEGGVTNLHPGSILQTHPNCTVFLDQGSASLMSKKP